MTQSHSDNRPLSEQFRLAGLAWAEADGAATLMEETKTARLSQHIQNIIDREGHMPHAHAERMVKASLEWHSEVEIMVQLRTKANKLRIELDYIRMLAAEQQSYAANKRAEMRL